MLRYYQSDVNNDLTSWQKFTSTNFFPGETCESCSEQIPRVENMSLRQDHGHWAATREGKKLVKDISCNDNFTKGYRSNPAMAAHSGTIVRDPDRDWNLFFTPLPLRCSFLNGTGTKTQKKKRVNKAALSTPILIWWVQTWTEPHSRSL